MDIDLKAIIIEQLPTAIKHLLADYSTFILDYENKRITVELKSQPLLYCAREYFDELSEAVTKVLGERWASCMEVASPHVGDLVTIYSPISENHLKVTILEIKEDVIYYQFDGFEITGEIPRTSRLIFSITDKDGHRKR